MNKNLLLQNFIENDNGNDIRDQHPWQYCIYLFIYSEL